MKTNENSFVILIPGFADSETDTTCLPMQQSFVKNLKQQYPGLRLIVLAFQYPYEIKKYEWSGIEVRSFSGKNQGGLKRFLLRRKLFSVLRAINQENKIAGLLSFWYGECAWVGKRFADRYDLQHYCWIMGQDARSDNKYVSKIEIGPENLIALSDSLADEFQKNYGQRPYHTIPAGVDPREFQKNSRAKDIDILGAGSLIALKRFDVFIEIIKALKRKFPDIRAMILGDGPEINKLREKIVLFELSDNIELPGEVSHPEVLDFMQRSRLFLHPSGYEGFSGVCLEAIYGGARVISFTSPMKKDIDGWLVAGSVVEMEQMAEDILLKEETHKTDPGQFLIQDTVKKMIHLYKIG